MVTTLEPITVKPIEIKAGLCGSCFHYRYCEHQQEGNLICSRCVAILKNQKRLIIEISELPKEEIAKQPKVKREKQLNIKRTKQIKTRKPRTPIEKVREKICTFLLTNKMCYSAKDIAQKFRISHKYAWEILSSLVESGRVAPSAGRKRNKLYAHVCHAEILQKYQGNRIGHISNRVKIKSTLDSNDKVITTAEIHNLLQGKYGKSTIIACLRLMVQEGEALTYFDHSLDCEMFASAINENAVKDFQKNYRQTENKILDFLKTGTKSRQQIAAHLGKHPRSIKAVSKILELLQEKGKVEFVRIEGRGSFVKLSRESI
jgi:predicted ArsR family transcriptional regulator